MKERWIDITGYEGYYQVSNMGRVKSLHYGKEIFLKPGKDNKGYYRVVLSKGNKRYTKKVHRLVAEAFVEGMTETKNQVNHINEIKTDNVYSNLEWCDYTYNNIYGKRLENVSRKVIAIFKDRNKREYKSQSEAARELNIFESNISMVISGKYNQTNGILFIEKEEN